MMINRSQEEITSCWETRENLPLVSIRCTVYNHDKYLEDCLNGFLIQKTTFPFEVFIHDDASTDSSASIIRKYVSKYPKIFKPFYEKENQYSKNDGSFRKITWNPNYLQGKYIAICEGDDYWTDPHKLQMQVDWLEAHPEYSMCCSNAFIQSSTRTLSGARYWKDCNISIMDMIRGRSCFIQTSTFLIRKKLLDFYPEYCKKCYIGDYPLQIWAAFNGKVRYFKKKTSLYRYCHSNSFTSSSYKKDVSSIVKGIKSELTMLQGLDAYSKHCYHKIFIKTETSFVLQKAFFYAAAKQEKRYIDEILSFFPEVSQSFSFYQKIDLFIAKHFPFFIYRTKRIFDQILKVLTRPSSRNLFDFYQKIQETILSS